MAASLVGEAKVRVVPSFNDFHGKVKRHLESKRVQFDVDVTAKTQAATAEMMAWRLRQESNAVTVPIKADLKDLRKNLSEVTHIFKRNSLVEAVRLNVKVIGLDALPALALAAGSAASGLDALGKSAYLLPAALSAAGASLGALMVGLSGVGDAFKSYGKDADDSSQRVQKAIESDKEFARAKRDMVSAIRDQKRELEDLNAELRRSSLNEADAILNVQESADRLKEGGFKSITEFQRAQIRYLRDLDGLQDVRKNNLRLLDDTNSANAKGIAGSDKVSDAIDRMSKSLDSVEQGKVSEVAKALAKLSPEARSFVESTRSMEGAWKSLKFSVQDNLFEGLDSKVTEIGAKVLPGLQIGLSKVASGLNSNVVAAMDSVGSKQNQGFLDRIFGNTAGGLEQMKRGIDPLISAFLRLSDVGSQFMPRIGDAFAKVFGDFDAWTKKISDDGSLRTWIDQGLDSIVALSNTFKNLGSIISSVAKAFNVSSGTEGGFIGTMQRKSEELAAYLRSGEGQSSLVGYFNQARDLIRAVADAFRDIKPLIKDVVEAARDWSVVLLNVGGAFATTARFLDQQTGLLKPLLMLYFSFKTFRPIVEGLVGAWSNYGKALGALGKVDPTGMLARSSAGLGQMKQGFSTLTPVVSAANKQLGLNRTGVAQLNTATTALFAPTNNMVGAFDKFRGAAGQAATAVGNPKASSVSLGGALGGLASFLGPAIFGAAIALGLGALSKLENKHRDAATAANAQADALDRIKGSLDAVSGAVGSAALAETSTMLQGVSIPNLGKQNAYDAAARTGVATDKELLAATVPGNTAQADAINTKNLAGAKAKIEGSEAWNRRKDDWVREGVDAETMARAALGESGALDKVAKAEKGILGKSRRDMNQFDRTMESAQVLGDRLPSVTDIIESAGAQDYVTVGIGLNGARSANAAGGDAIRQSTRAQYEGKLNSAATTALGAFGTSDDRVFIDPANPSVATINTDREPTVAPELGSVSQLNPNEWQIRLTEEGTKAYVQKFAQGGVIGGVGSGTSDSNLMLGSKGEFVTRAKAVDHYGQSFFHQLNSMSLPQGLSVGGPMPMSPAAPKVPDWQQQAVAGMTKAGISSAVAPMPVLRIPNLVDDGNGNLVPMQGPPKQVDSRPYQPGSGTTKSTLNLGNPNAFSITAPPPTLVKSPLGSAPKYNSGVVTNKPVAQMSDGELADKQAKDRAKAINSSAAANYTGKGLAANATEYKNIYGDTKRGVPPGGLKPATLPVKTGTPLTPPVKAGSPAPRPPGASPIGKTWDYTKGAYVAAPGTPAAAASAGPVAHSGSGMPPGPGAQSNTDHGYTGGGVPGPGATVPAAALPAAVATAASGPVIGRSGAALNPQVAQQLGMIGYGLPAQTNIPYGAGGFPSWVYELGGRFGLQVSTYPNHQVGADGLNKGIDFSGTPAQMRAFAEYAMTVPGVEQVIYRDPRDGAMFGIDPGDRAPGQSIADYYGDDWSNHESHVHLRTSRSLPLPEQLAAMGMGLPALPAGVDLLPGVGQVLGQASAAAAMTPGQFNGAGGAGKKLNFFENIAAYFEGQSWLDPKNATEFLGGQANNVGSQLFSIGSQFLSGFTGLDFSSMVGYGQEVGGFLMDKGQGEEGEEEGAAGTDLNAAVGANIDRYINGQLSLGQTGGLDGVLGSAGAGDIAYNPSLGAEQWRPAVRKAIAAYGPSYGITNAKAWEDALVRQIASESNGNPAADNPNDSNGQGGKQHVSGLLQFLPQTFADNNISGGSYTDPLAQIAAAIAYVAGKYGMASDGSPNQIGRGVGYARGGLIRRFARGGKLGGVGGPRSDSNLVRVSRGEFLNSAAAVKHYGPGLFASLNSMQVPKDGLPGFADGMLWPENAPAPLPAPAAAPMPVPPPPPMPAPAAGVAGQSAGPLPQGAVGASVVDTAPSTGGAPGSGATAPAPDPGALPSVGEALTGLSETAGGAGGAAAGANQPGASSSDTADPRATLGMAPASGDHTNPAISGAISGAASTIGSLAATAASLGAGVGTAGASAAMPGGMGSPSAGIQAGAQIAGAVATGAVNILSSLLVGTATNGSTANASGVPMLPQRPPIQTGVDPNPGGAGGRVHNGDIYVSDMSDYRRTTERMDAQAQMPFIGKF